MNLSAKAIAVILAFSWPGLAPIATAQQAEISARASIDWLAKAMDEYHDRFQVYEDVNSPGNHFFTWARIPEGVTDDSVQINGSWTSSPHSGATAIRCEFRNTTGSNFGGFLFQNGF